MDDTYRLIHPVLSWNNSSIIACCFGIVATLAIKEPQDKRRVCVVRSIMSEDREVIICDAGSRPRNHLLGQTVRVVLFSVERLFGVQIDLAIMIAVSGCPWYVVINERCNNPVKIGARVRGVCRLTRNQIAIKYNQLHLFGREDVVHYSLCLFVIFVIYKSCQDLVLAWI